jgi:hypothetical protein
MKITRTLLIGLGMIALTQIGCKKDNDVNQPEPEPVSAKYYFEVNRLLNSGGTFVHREQVENVNGDEDLVAWLKEDDSEVELRIGNEDNGAIHPTFFASVTFNFTVNPFNIVGTYHFPADNMKARLLFTEKLQDNNGYLVFMAPQSGKLIISYDRETKSFRGTFENVTFIPPLNANYNSMRLDGSFSNVRTLP